MVANVDDQVVLTIQAAVNYLTKYMGKLGSGHTATSRIGGLLDDILRRMRDDETMTVTSLLSKLFIHTAAPDQICSLEARLDGLAARAVQPIFCESECQGAACGQGAASHPNWHGANYRD